MAGELKAKLEAEQFFQALHPTEKDECLYQEARRIVIAEVLSPHFLFVNSSLLFIQFQNIAYKEYLPVIVGPKMMQEYNLLIGNGPTQYDPQRDPRVSNEFATVIFYSCPSFSDM